jgi:Protein of unknown function (DUF551)
MSEDIEKAALLECDKYPEHNHLDVIAIFKAGAEYTAPKWIRVKERLPNSFEDGCEQECDVYVPSEGLIIRALLRGGRFWSLMQDGYSKQGNYGVDQVSHWLPLATAPEKEGK